MTKDELLDTIRKLATEWATQSNDYDEDTEQQIDDGRVLLGLLDGPVEPDLPLGYVALSKSRLLDGGWRYRMVGSNGWVHETPSAAAKYCAVSSDERAYVVAEISREVQP